ncbi:MAG: redoxin domain-containing protein [Alistipes indistinctus]
MKAMIGKKAPHIDATAVVNGNQIVEHFSLDQYVGNKYVVLFFYRSTSHSSARPSCMPSRKSWPNSKAQCSRSRLFGGFEFSHFAWLQTDKNKGGIHGVTFPIISDLSKTISENYGVLASDYDYDDDGNAISTGTAVAYRGLFLIDKEGNIRHCVINDLPLGRNVDEVLLRMVDAHANTSKSSARHARPSWSKGKDAMEAFGAKVWPIT